jgi:creatinine amidohydrolase
LDILASLAQFGFKSVVGINAHRDIEQHVVIIEAFKAASEKFGINARYAFAQNIMPHYGLKGDEQYIYPVKLQAIQVSSSRIPDIHAGDIETATMHHFYPNLTDKETARSLPAVDLSDDKIWSWILGGQTNSLSPQGYLGSPADFETVDVLKNIEDIADRVSQRSSPRKG